MTALDAFTLGRRNRVSPSALHVVLVLIEDSPLNCSTIAERTGTTLGNVSSMLERLEASGWVIRLRNPNDRRTVQAIPSERAFEVFSPAVEEEKLNDQVLAVGRDGSPPAGKSL